MTIGELSEKLAELGYTLLGGMCIEGIFIWFAPTNKPSKIMSISCADEDALRNKLRLLPASLY